jgi:hypothetical protein
VKNADKWETLTPDDEPAEGYDDEARLSDLQDDGSGENTELSMMGVFSDPREYRTMGRLTKGTVERLAYIEAKGRMTGSTLRQRLVENIFLMSRTTDGWGSTQMRDIAISRQQEKKASSWLDFFKWGGNNDESKGGE